MRITLLCCLLAVCAVLGPKLAPGDEALYKSSIGVVPKGEVTATTHAPIAVTGETTFDYSRYILTMTGTVNAQGLPTTVWFEYGTVSGSYSEISATQVVSGTSDTFVSVDVTIGSLPPNEYGIMYYYYRIVAENEMGRSYGEEKSIGLLTPVPDCLCSVSGKVTDAVSKQGIVNAAIRSYEGSTSYTNKSGYYVWDNGMVPCTSGGIYDFTASADGYEPLTQYIDVQPCVEGVLNFKLQPTGTPTPIPDRIFGSVVDKKGNPLHEVRVTLKGKRTKIKKETTSDASGYFAFEGLEKDIYKITAKKKGYRKSGQSVELEEGEVEERVEIVMKKT